MYGEEKKIRITLNKEVVSILEEDCIHLKKNKNYLLNYIFRNLYSEKIILKFKNSEEKKVIQFNLNKKNRELYYNLVGDGIIKSDADYFRNLIYRYSYQNRINRELFILKDIVDRIKFSIEKKKVLNIKFHDNRKVRVLAFYIGESKIELGNYLFCYDIEEKQYKNYKLSNISNIYITLEEMEIPDKKFVKKVIENFDPFLSTGKQIVVKLSENGVKLLSNLPINRPELIEKKDDIYTFKCSQEQGKRYFSYFLDEVEILEPLELRNWFSSKLKLALKKYEDK